MPDNEAAPRESETPRRPYTPPQLLRVDLETEQVLGDVCKTGYGLDCWVTPTTTIQTPAYQHGS